MIVVSLREDLLRIPGIESAELDGDVDSPDGVRVRLAAGFDTELVGEEIRRVLAAHGLRSELAPEASHVRPVPVVPVSDDPEATPPVQIAPARVIQAEVSPEETAVGVPEAVHLTTIRAESAGRDVPAGAPERAAPEGDDEGEPQQTVPEVVSPMQLSSVAVEEGRSGMAVVATSMDGSREGQRARAGAQGLDEAVVVAVARLVAPDVPPPLIVAITTAEIEGSQVITAVLDVEGERAVGSSVVEGGRPYAVGRAVWAALSSG